jgi:hypothetical protein
MSCHHPSTLRIVAISLDASKSRGVLENVRKTRQKKTAVFCKFYHFRYTN